MNRQTEESIMIQALEAKCIYITDRVRRAVKDGLRNIRIGKYEGRCRRKEKAACAMAIHRRQERAKVIRKDENHDVGEYLEKRAEAWEVINRNFAEDTEIALNYETGQASAQKPISDDCR